MNLLVPDVGFVFMVIFYRADALVDQDCRRRFQLISIATRIIFKSLDMNII